MTKSLDIDGPVSICPLGIMCIDFDGGIRLNYLIHTAGEVVNSSTIQCVHDITGVCIFPVFYLLPMDHLCTNR